ncbi:hypothetical protein [Ramlibacter humi]|uniref:Uncharacterized protein n=1 Tax=Ramlibacter humi TaxID=2530451 RepID=A0A4Z0BH49_9BURK|nr:hypothetical protein [Ramlibacter humi]TFY97577.1 hypothetical protein EZ216_17760 [Ramlibacter humi]
MIRDISQNERLALAHLLLTSGREPHSFNATVQPDGLVRVTGPRGTAFYPRNSWFASFSRHLERSFFDPAVPAPAGPRLERRTPLATAAIHG